MSCAHSHWVRSIQSIDLSNITEIEMANQIILLVARTTSMDWLYPVRMLTTTGNWDVESVYWEAYRSLVTVVALVGKRPYWVYSLLTNAGDRCQFNWRKSYAFFWPTKARAVECHGRILASNLVIHVKAPKWAFSGVVLRVQTHQMNVLML